MSPSSNSFIFLSSIDWESSLFSSEMEISSLDFDSSFSRPISVSFSWNCSFWESLLALSIVVSSIRSLLSIQSKASKTSWSLANWSLVSSMTESFKFLDIIFSSDCCNSTATSTIFDSIFCCSILSSCSFSLPGSWVNLLASSFTISLSELLLTIDSLSSFSFCTLTRLIWSAFWGCVFPSCFSVSSKSLAAIIEIELSIYSWVRSFAIASSLYSYINSPSVSLFGISKFFNISLDSFWSTTLGSMLSSWFISFNSSLVSGTMDDSDPADMFWSVSTISLLPSSENLENFLCSFSPVSRLKPANSSSAAVSDSGIVSNVELFRLTWEMRPDIFG